jgi:hypothetical protein
MRLNRAADYDVEEQALPALHTEHLRHRIREVLAALPDEQRRAIRLRLFEARSDAEIAPLLGVTPQRVSPLWNSGFTTLGQRYAPTPLSGGGRGRISRPLTMIVSSAGAAPNADDRSGSRAWSRSPGACRAKRSSFPRTISRTPSGCI